jgi:hypothetical protein
MSRIIYVFHLFMSQRAPARNRLQPIARQVFCSQESAAVRCKYFLILCVESFCVSITKVSKATFPFIFAEYQALRTTIWDLRKSHARTKCIHQRKGFPISAYKLNIAWHIRSGDICLHACRDSDKKYFVGMINMLNFVLGVKKLPNYCFGLLQWLS